MKPAFRMELPHGLVVGIACADVDPVRDVHPEEEPLTAGFAEHRRRTFAAGRAAMRAAMRELDRAVGAIAWDDRGAPVLPEGWVGSIAHKDRVAVAIARPEDGSRVGVDVEPFRQFTIDISSRVLTDEERDLANALDAEERARFILRRFSMKEAIYKAIDPFLRRYVAFREVTIREAEGGFVVVDRFRPGEPRLGIEVASIEIEACETQLVVSSARAWRLGDPIS